MWVWQDISQYGQMMRREAGTSMQNEDGTPANFAIIWIVS
jgi:hypothetical protein